MLVVYRVTRIPREGEDGRWVWIGLFGAELWFSLYWVCTQALRWNYVYRCTFRDRLTQRFENELPRVDIFVCTVEPMIEPPMMVINTVLSVMAFDYPPEKLSVYLSDDADSDVTFYALLEASHFTKHWIPYCKKFNVEPRSPGAYFLSISDHYDVKEANEFLAIKKLYEDMEKRIRKAAKLGRLSEEIRSKHEEFSQFTWGKEMGLLYGCPVEDVLTGLAVQCRGWKSMYYNPDRKAFIGLATNTLDIHLVQFKRWSEGLFQIFFSKYCPFIHGHGKIKLGAQMGYCVYLLWAPVSLPTLYYIIVPPLCLLHDISLFPKVSSPHYQGGDRRCVEEI